MAIDDKSRNEKQEYDIKKRSRKDISINIRKTDKYE